MKIENIKTINQFNDFADVWYQRTHNLREVWQNNDETLERRIKAFKLFHIMSIRVLNLVQFSMKLQQYNPKDF
jgi:hypothetical protein